MSAAGMLTYWGARCDDYEPACACCAAWRLYDESGAVPSDDVVWHATQTAQEADGDA